LPAEWGTGQPCPYDEAELGELLRRIHDLGFDADFGFLGDDLARRTFSLPDLGPTSARWAEFFHCDHVARLYLQKGYLDPDEAEILSSLPDRLSDELRHVERRLLHLGDVMHNGNLIVDPGTGRTRAILDYAESTAGDPRWELAWIRYYFADYPFERSTFDLDRFWDGYVERSMAPTTRSAVSTSRRSYSSRSYASTIPSRPGDAGQSRRSRTYCTTSAGDHPLYSWTSLYFLRKCRRRRAVGFRGAQRAAVAAKAVFLTDADPPERGEQRPFTAK
jgi:hypothetical protein